MRGPRPKQINTGTEPEGLVLTSDGLGRTKLQSPPGSFVQGARFYGNLMDYPSSGGMTSGTIQYVQVTLSVGVTYSMARTFINSGGSAARFIRMGIYDQVDPSDPDGIPNDLVKQTNSVNTNVPGGTFYDVPLNNTLTVGGSGADDTFTVPVSGFYWIAIVASSGSISFAVTNSNRANFLPVRRESGPGTDLPATAGDFGALSNPVSALSLAMLIED